MSSARSRATRRRSGQRGDVRQGPVDSRDGLPPGDLVVDGHVPKLRAQLPELAFRRLAARAMKWLGATDSAQLQLFQ